MQLLTRPWLKQPTTVDITVDIHVKSVGALVPARDEAHHLHDLVAVPPRFGRLSSVQPDQPVEHAAEELRAATTLLPPPQASCVKHGRDVLSTFYLAAKR